MAAMLAGARDGRGGGLVLRGEPGIGKSTLLDHAAARAAGFRVLRTAGVEPETELGYAALHRLLWPVRDRIDGLPGPQAEALGAVFGRTAPAELDRFVVAMATLSLLADLALAEPVLCLVDDAHWADRPSLDVFAFVARRLAAEPIALLLAARADDGQQVDGAGLVDLPLAGLDRDAALALLGRAALSVAEREALLRDTGGNPLAILELPPGSRAGAEPLPLAESLRGAFLARVAELDESARRLLLLVAADGSGRPDVIRRAAKALDVDPARLAGGELDGLLRLGGPEVTFRHPLIRSAVYHGAGPAARRAAHRALAAALAEDAADDSAADRRAWHLGQAADGPDEAVAVELERSAERAAGRAGPAAAAAALTRAAELSTTSATRDRRSVAAANAWWRGGHPARAAALLDQAGQQTREIRWDAVRLRALMQLRAGTPGDAVALLWPVLPEVLATEPRRAIELLMVFGEASYHANATAAWAEIAAVVEAQPLPGDGLDDALARMFRAACRVRSGTEPGLAPGDLDLIARHPDPTALCWAGGMAYGLGEHEYGRRLRLAAAARARSHGAIGTLAWVLVFLVTDDMVHGRFATAAAYTQEGRRFAEETGQPNLTCWYDGTQAMLAALRGRPAEARRIAERVLVEAAGRRLAAATATAYRALALLDLAAGRAGDALAHLRVLERGGEQHPGLMLDAVPDLVEAAARAGRAEEVAARLDPFSRWADSTGSPDLQALAARCRALLADDQEPGLRAALRLHAAGDRPLERARTELLLGEHLRRSRRPVAARAFLRAALDTFRTLGALAWATRAADELRAAGETSAPDAGSAEPDALASLTPQELRIAMAVAEGATNREVAAQLFLSPRTVDYHLRKVFKKVGISSRAELIRLVTAR